ncbi:MAG: serine hydrolase, partial [Bacteroidales bacterium]
PRAPHPLAEASALGFRPYRRSYLPINLVPHDGVFGDKGVYSTTIDLYKWDRAITDATLLPPQVWDQAFEPATLQNERTVNYGQGWRLQTFLDKRVVHHPGRWSGFRTSFKRFIDEDATLILLSNNNRDISPIVEGMQNILFHKEIQWLSENPVESAQAAEEEETVPQTPSFN